MESVIATADGRRERLKLALLPPSVELSTGASVMAMLREYRPDIKLEKGQSLEARIQRPYLYLL
jgi:hypothetical protein